MALRNISIPIPESRITYKKTASSEARYVYHIVRRYRNAQGTPTGEEKLIGKEDLQRPGRMIPNDNYTHYYPEPTDVINLDGPTKVLDAGHTALLRLRAHKLNLVSCLKQVFPDTYEQLLMTAIYMCCEGNVMMNFDLFQDQSLLAKGVRLRPQQCSEMFADISWQNRMDFFHLWTEQVVPKGETIAYDVTSLSTYAKIDAEFGYNRDHEALAQLNIGFLYGTSTPSRKKNPQNNQSSPESDANHSVCCVS